MARLKDGGTGIDEAYREFKRREQELDELLHPPRRKSKGKAGRPPSLKAEQVAALQEEYRDHRGERKIAQHLQAWAKKKFKLDLHIDTIRDRIIKPVDDTIAKLEK